MRTALTWAAAAVLPLLVALTLGGCGQNKPPVCSDVKSLQRPTPPVLPPRPRVSGDPPSFQLRQSAGPLPFTIVLRHEAPFS